VTNQHEAQYRIKPHEYAVVITIGLLQAASLVALLLLIIRLVTELQNGSLVAGDRAALGRIIGQLAVMVVLAIVFGVLRGFEFAYTERVGYRVVRELRMRMYSHLQGMSPRQVQGRSRGGLLLRFVGDLSMLRMWISRGRLSGLVALIVLTITLSVMAFLNIWITLAFISTTALGAALSFSRGDGIRSVTRTMRRRRSALTSNVDEQIHSLAVPQVFGRSSGEFSRLSRQNDSLTDSLVKVANQRGILRAITLSTSQLTIVAVLAAGAMEIYRGQITIALVVAAITITRLLSGPIRTLGLAHDYWQRSRVSVRKLDDYLRSSSRPLNDPTKERLRVRRGGVAFEDVSVPGALDGVRLTAEPGQLVAITGPSGAGKSTLLGLVSRFVDPDSGQVLIDGQSLADVTLESTYRRVGVVGPELPLMRGTVRRNLTYRNKNASDDELQRVILATGLDTVIDELPNGLETWINEGASNISSGQRQRIAVARAMLGNPPILLLDEPSSNLDPASREAFRHVLARHHGTILLVTHDPIEMSLADQVWHLANGRVEAVETGEGYRDRLWQQSQQASRWAEQVQS
jgi:ABC-type multidrug transport system fused ATPase/permease subunit